MKKHYCTQAKVAVDIAAELARCPGATLSLWVNGKELFVTGIELDETTSLGGRQRTYRLTTEGVD